ncbi:MAG: TonB-dependent receptor [Candidatus Didemnitutus sp.]|nr:TonB-dependent receptor [Candidatus Didemnitutus sp.]
MLPTPTARRHVVAGFVRGFQCGALLGRWLAGLALMAVLAVPSFAQTAGEISGRVLNVGTGRYLNNARVTVEGTTRETFTNEFGEYRLADLPVGPVTVRVTYTGLDTKSESVNVTAGQSTTLDFDLTSADRYGKAGDDKVVQLDTFVVQSNREYEGNALATNEQRYSPNVKVVMAADAFGAVNEGNPGEFLKYLPGVTVDYVAADVRTVSVRGFASNFSNVYWDGMRLTSSASGSSNRVFEFEQVSINNTSRTEIVKLPTPDLPADSLGGSVNLVSKNAFERKGAQFNYRVYLNMNSENTSLNKTPGPGVDKTFKVLPNFDFDYTLPVNDRFGIVITGLSSNQHVEQHRWQPTWNFQQGGGTYTPAGGSATTITAATPSNPYLQQWQIQDGPKTTNRDSIGIKADWKLTKNQTLSIAYQDNYYHSFFGNRNLNFNMGTSGTPSSNTGTPLSYGPDFVQAATGRGSVTQGSSFRDKYGNTSAGNIFWKWSNADWDVDAGLSGVQSRTWYRALGRGHFANVGTTLVGVSNVRADGIAFPGGMTITAKDAAGNVLDPYNLSNFRLGNASNDPIDGKATMKSGRINAERHFDSWTIPINVKAGAEVREEGRDNRRYSESYTFVGPDGVANTADDNAGAFLDQVYKGSDSGFGSKPIQWINPYLLADSYANNPAYWTTNAVTNETNRINNSEKMSERVTAGYLQVDGRLMHGKLRFVTGVRYEKTNDKGQGVLNNPDVVWQRTSTGAYVDGDPNTAGIQRVLRTDIGALTSTGAANSVQAVRAILQERGYRANRSYDGYYPSLHLTYEIKENLLLRAAYAKTFGRPDYANIIPATTIDEDNNDPNAVGSVTIRNTALKPWTANNYDLSIEYYPEKGGLMSIGAFQKKLSNFWQTRSGAVDAALASELGLDPRYIGWAVSTTVNGGDAEVSGWEFSVIRPLTMLPGWGRYFTVRANGTALHLSGDKTPDFRGFISKTGNFSVSFSKKPIVLTANLNFRGRQKGTSATAAAAQTGAQYGTANGFYEYYAPRYNLDLSAEYKLNKHFTFFVSGRNVLNKEQVIERFNPDTPAYARGFRWEEFGVNYSFGIKGTF